METVCPKCNHVRSDLDDPAIPSSICPKCHVVYAKALANSSQHVSKHLKQGSKPKSKIYSEPVVYVDEKLPFWRSGWALSLIIFVSLSIGYFAGREHVKYEMRQALSGAAEQFKKSMSDAFGSRKRESNVSQPAGFKRESKKDEKINRYQEKITVALLNKSFREFDLNIGNSAITFKLEFENKFDKPVRAFEGTLVFSDILGNIIKRLNLSFTDPIRPGEVVLWSGQMDYNQFISSDRTFKNIDAEDFQVRMELDKVLFVDGETRLF